MELANIESQILLFVATILLPCCALAENSKDWTFTVAPYVWATGMKGEVATLPPAAPAEIDLSFSDVVEGLDISLMGLVEARKGRFGAFGELFYVGVSADADTPGPFYAQTEYEQDLWALSVGGSYAVIQDQARHLDVVGGVRYWDMDNQIELDAGVAPSAKRSERESWMDLFIGLKGRARIDQRWYVTGWAVSAVAGGSDTAWDVLAAVGYEIDDDFSLTVGYRHQEVDFRDGEFIFDVELSGPIVGLVWRI